MEVLQQRQTAQASNLRQQHQASDTPPLHNMCVTQAVALHEVVGTSPRKDHTQKKTQASRSCDYTVVSPAGTVHLPTTGPLWTDSFMSSRWAVALQPGTKPRRYSRCCVCSRLIPGMAFIWNEPLSFPVATPQSQQPERRRYTQRSSTHRRSRAVLGRPVGSEVSGDRQRYLSRTLGVLTCF